MGYTPFENNTEIPKREKVKDHFQRNHKAYISGGACLLTGIAVGAYAVRTGETIKVQPKITQIASWKPHATLEVHIEALGDPGNIIQDLTTGTVYASQGQAAKELGLTAARISEQLKGARDHVNGHVFEKLGKATASQ